MKWLLGLAILLICSPASADLVPRAPWREPGKFLDHMEQFRASPKTTIGKRYGLIGNTSYSLAQLDNNRATARHWADEQVRLGKIKKDRRERAVVERSEYLRTRDYPKGWTKHERHKLYAREVADLERLRIARDKRMEVAVRERANRLIAKMQPKLDANLKAAWDADDREKAEKAGNKAVGSR